MLAQASVVPAVSLLAATSVAELQPNSDRRALIADAVSGKPSFLYHVQIRLLEAGTRIGRFKKAIVCCVSQHAANSQSPSSPYLK